MAYEEVLYELRLYDLLSYGTRVCVYHGFVAKNSGVTHSGANDAEQCLTAAPFNDCGRPPWHTFIFNYIFNMNNQLNNIVDIICLFLNLHHFP